MVDLSRLMQDAAILEVIDKSADEASNLSAQNSYQAMRIEELERELAEARAELDQWTKWGVIEVAIRNPSVSECLSHWEGRALKAEAALERLKVAEEALRVMQELLDYEDIRVYVGWDLYSRAMKSLAAIRKDDEAIHDESPPSDGVMKP